MPFSMRLILCLTVTVLAGCQASPPASFDLVFPFYASKAEAQAVAAGNFGAVPVEMPAESDIELNGNAPCNSGVAAVKSRAGRAGWIPVDALPRRLQSSLICATETASKSLEPARVGKPPLSAQLQP